jgi:YVTN family beta-propeller protein
MTISDLAVGSELLGYRVEGLVGRGGMGVVYVAEDVRLRRRVALKLLDPRLAEDGAFRERFLAESELAASLDHPCVVPIYQAGEADGRLFIAMRYVEGSDLKRRLRDGPLSPARTVAICAQVADALDFAHERGLVHRDVKPSNVLIDERDHAYLADFGLTKRVAQPHAVERGLSGTIDYIAPEQIRGERVDGRADVYSLGCVLCECLTGKPPFPRATDAAVLFAHLEEQPAPPAGLEQVIGKALAKEPDDRYPSCGELIDAAREALGVGAPGTSRLMRVPVLSALAGVLLLAIGLAVFFALGGSGGAVGPKVISNSVAVLNPGTGALVGDVPVGALPGDIAAGSGAIWVANRDDRTISQIDPASQQVVSTTAPENQTSVDGLAVDATGLWVSDISRSVAVRIDPTFRTVANTTRIAPSPPPLPKGGPVAVGAGSVWVANGDASIVRIDPQSGAVRARIDVGNDPEAIAVGDGAVWVADFEDDTVTRINPATNTVSGSIPVGQEPSAIAVGAGGVWVPNTEDNNVERIDPSTGAVIATIAVGRRPTGVTVGAGSVWVANSLSGTVSRVDPATDRVAATLTVGQSPQDVLVADGRLWVSVGASPFAGAPALGPRNGGTLRVLLTADPGGGDPALLFADLQRAYATCALLLNYPDQPFPQGSQLQPEVASGFPVISDGGRTYTYTIRPGFRFSPPDNQVVTAAAFKRAVERALSPTMGAVAGSIMGDIVGAPAYIAGRTTRLAGVTASGDSLVVHLARPSPTLPARLATPYFCAVPPDAPNTPNGVATMPSAGPYYVAAYVPGKRLVVVRNPNYHGPRPHRLAEIDYELGVPAAQAVSEVTAGQADYYSNAVLGSGIPAASQPQLAALYGPTSTAAREGRQRYFVEPQLTVFYLLFNTHRAPFNDVRVRQAVNYALDRLALATVPWPQFTGKPADEYLPPGIPGYQEGDIYPLGGPDLTKARQLVGHTKRQATLYACNLPTCAQFAKIVRANLSAIGIDVKVRQLSFHHVSTAAVSPNPSFDLVPWAWTFEYPDPFDFVNEQFQSDLSLTHLFSNASFDRRMRLVAQLAGPRRYLAYEQLDNDLVRDAVPAAAYASATTVSLFSARVGCELTQPIYGIDLGALCVRQ